MVDYDNERRLPKKYFAKEGDSQTYTGRACHPFCSDIFVRDSLRSRLHRDDRGLRVLHERQRRSGANVTATVAGCSGGAPNGCTGASTTDNNHYYVIANLNLPPNGSITASAVKGSASGSKTDNADQFQAAYINITLCGSAFVTFARRGA